MYFSFKYAFVCFLQDGRRIFIRYSFLGLHFWEGELTCTSSLPKIECTKGYVEYSFFHIYIIYILSNNNNITILTGSCILIEKKLKYFAGLHLTGINSNRSTMVLLSGGLLDKKLKLEAIFFEKLSCNSVVFSDDSIIGIVKRYDIENICIDSPLTLPPCVACQREVCPGVDLCEDMTLSYMQSIINLTEHKKTRKKSF